MLSSQAASDLDFYRELQRLNPNQPDTRRALGFARVWHELARRVLAAYAAQLGREVRYPPALALPALQAYLDKGTSLRERDFLAQVPASWSGVPAQLLADLARWLAGFADPAQPLGTSYQVWVGTAPDRNIRLLGPPAPPPPPPLKLLDAPPCLKWIAQSAGMPVAVVAHYDVHGLSMLAATLRTLQATGVARVDCILSFEQTGDISKLWKRTVPRLISSEEPYAAVIMIDCSIHSRHPDRTRKAIAKLDDASGTQLVMIDHHDDTIAFAPELLHPRLDLVLTDVPSCGLLTGTDEPTRALMVLGALGDKVPEVTTVFSRETHPQLHAANQAYHQRLVHFSPTPRELKQQGVQPMRPLWEQLAAGAPVTPQLAEDALGELPTPTEPVLPDALRCGELLFVTSPLPAVGRTWYALLEVLMAQAGTSYAAALRILDGRRANMLLLTHWEATHLPPVRYFVPPEYLHRCLGHMAAVWVDVPSDEALTLLESVARRLNSFMETAGDFQPVAQLLTRNIIDPATRP